MNLETIPQMSLISVDDAALLRQAEQLRAERGYEAWTTEEIKQALFELIELEVKGLQDSYFWDEETFRKTSFERMLDRIARNRDRSCLCIFHGGDRPDCPKHGSEVPS